MDDNYQENSPPKKMDCDFEKFLEQDAYLGDSFFTKDPNEKKDAHSELKKIKPKEIDNMNFYHYEDENEEKNFSKFLHHNSGHDAFFNQEEQELLNQQPILLSPLSRRNSNLKEQKLEYDFNDSYTDLKPSELKKIYLSNLEGISEIGSPSGDPFFMQNFSGHIIPHQQRIKQHEEMGNNRITKEMIQQQLEQQHIPIIEAKRKGNRKRKGKRNKTIEIEEEEEKERNKLSKIEEKTTITKTTTEGKADKPKVVNININLYGKENVDINTLMNIANQQLGNEGNSHQNAFLSVNNIPIGRTSGENQLYQHSDIYLPTRHHPNGTYINTNHTGEYPMFPSNLNDHHHHHHHPNHPNHHHGHFVINQPHLDPINDPNMIHGGIRIGGIGNGTTESKKRKRGISGIGGRILQNERGGNNRRSKKRKISKNGNSSKPKNLKLKVKKSSISQMEKIRRDIEAYVLSTKMYFNFEDLANGYFARNLRRFSKRNFIKTKFRLNTGNGKLRVWKNTRVLVLCSANGKNLDKCAAYKIDNYFPIEYENRKLDVNFELLFTHKNSSKEFFMKKIRNSEHINWCDMSENIKIKDTEQKLKTIDGRNVVCYSVKFQIKGGRNPNNSHHGIFYLLRKNVIWNNKIVSGTQYLFRRFSYKNNEATKESNFFSVDSYQEN